MTSRRDFIRYTVVLGAGLFLTARLKPSQVAHAQSGPGHSHHGGIRRIATNPALQALVLDPTTITKYATQLVIPPAMPNAPKPKGIKGPKNFDYYQISVQQFSQQILPPPFGPTVVWSYGSAAHAGTHNYPAFTIEAKANKPVRVQWINGLVGADGAFLPHLLPVDQTLHWANPPGGSAGRDGHSMNPNPYLGPVPMVTHVHGAHTTDESDGYAEAWYLPKANNIPPGYATEGTWYSTFKTQFRAEKGEAWLPGSATFEYPNNQRAATLWYHDHTLGMTRLNVYAGPAGFYLLRGGPGDAVMDSRTNTAAILPGPAPKVGSNPFGTFFEIPIAIQDRSFKPDGQLFYPDNRAYFEGLDPEQLQIPFHPEMACDDQMSDVAPIWNPEFFGNTIVVNGRTWPFLNVQQRRYRLRLLNGCQSRFLILDFSSIPGVRVHQIGADGGFLPAPYDITAAGNRLLMSPAERADLIVDFTGVTQGSHVLGNVGPDEPFGGGVPGTDFPPADPATTGQIMQFNVGPIVGVDNTTPAQFLALPARAPLSAATVTRQLALVEEESLTVRVSEGEGGSINLDCDSDTPFGPIAALLGTMQEDTNNPGQFIPRPLKWTDPGGITENPAVGATEVWEMYNYTADAHPMHLHEVMFEVVGRQPFDALTGLPTGVARPPEAWETGTKDTVIAYPGEITRLKALFDLPGLYVWHCHIVEHEDNEMMRPYTVGLMPVRVP
jgi:FtsP/CotA-like multicopper oxidase with cupredoxin domain